MLLGHERVYWQNTAAREGLVKPEYQPDTLMGAVAAATLCGAADEDDAIRTLTRIPGLSGLKSPDLAAAARSDQACAALR